MNTRTALASALLLLAAESAEAGVRNYFAPQVTGARLDSCLGANTDCGKPAADAFCRTQGYDNALIFQREPADRTVRLGGRDVCSGATCQGFRQIKCYTAGDVPADLS